MDPPDVAGLPSGTGLHLGRDSGRASALLAKSVFSASSMRSPGAVNTVSDALTLPVQHVVMPRTRKIHSTDEVLRCPCFTDRVKADYKPYAKCRLYAPVAGTAFPRPRLQGWQQSRSRVALIPFQGMGPLERQNLRVPLRSPHLMGLVSPAAQATKWPEGTSSLQPACSLRNIPQQAGAAIVAVHPR